MKKTKVLILTGTMNVGGIENQLMHLIRHADKEKFQIDFTTTVDHPYYSDEIISLGGKIIQIPPTEGKHFWRYCKAIYRVMKTGGYDIVHSHELFHSGMVLLTAKLAGVKHRFVHAHNWCAGNYLGEKMTLKERAYTAIMQRLICRYATDFIACSSLAGEYLYGKKVTRQNNYHLVFNSVDTSRFLEHYNHIESGDYLDDGWINVIQVGRYTIVKNQMFALEIVEELRRREKKIRVLCVGDDSTDYGKRVRAKIERHGLEPYIKLLGIRKDVDVLMRKSSAFILPSKYEGMPLVLIEAQASGLQCVVADTFSREVDFGINTVKWLPESANASAWADAIEEAISKPKPEKDVVIEAVVKNGFDSKVFAKTICELYSNAVVTEK